MPRYFFHLLGDAQVILDDEGVLLEELNAAHSYGRKLQRQIREFSPEGSREWTVKIADESGDIRLVILPQWRDTLPVPLSWLGRKLKPYPIK